MSRFRPAAAVVALALPVARARNDEGGPLNRQFIADAAAKAAPAVVNITCAVAGGPFGVSRGVSAGSGFIIESSGVVITNAHVVARATDPRNVRVTMWDGRVFAGAVRAADAAADIAIVEMRADARRQRAPAPRALPTATIGSSSRLRAGEFVVALGSPLNLGRTVTAGIVSATARAGSEIGLGASRSEFLQTDAAINVGNSGGPLVNLDGEVIGVNTMKVAQADGISFAVPIEVAWPVATRLRRDGRVARPFLGFRFHQAPDGAGVVVVEVARGSPAEASGLEPGDRLLEFDGAQVGRVRDVTTRLVAVKPGQRLKLRIQRDGEGSAREVVIEARERSAPG